MRGATTNATPLTTGPCLRRYFFGLPAEPERLPTFATFLRLAKNSPRLGIGTPSPFGVFSVGDGFSLAM